VRFGEERGRSALGRSDVGGHESQAGAARQAAGATRYGYGRCHEASEDARRQLFQDTAGSEAVRKQKRAGL
jgi:hypothetical protein